MVGDRLTALPHRWLLVYLTHPEPMPTELYVYVPILPWKGGW